MTVNASAVPASRWRNLEGPSGRTVPILVGEEFDALGVALSVGMFSYSEAYRFLFDFLEPGATVLDLGAHIGTFTLAAASLGCRVVAFEAAPRNVSLLEASVAANQFDLVTVVAAAVAAEPGTLRFRPEGAFGQVSDNPELGDLVEVDAVTVPEALSRLGISSVDAIKIDIEGSEPAALDGMASLLDEETAPVLVIEGNAHTLRHFGHTPEDVLARTEALGYRNLLFHAGQLVEVTPRSVQPRTVVDYLAIRRPDQVPEGWVIRSPLTPEEVAAELLDEARTRDPDKRAHVWRVLQDADAALRAEPAARVAEALLRLDPARPSSPPPKEHPPDAPRGLVPRLRDEAEGLRLSARAFEYALTDYVEALRARRP